MFRSRTAGQMGKSASEHEIFWVPGNNLFWTITLHLKCCVESTFVTLTLLSLSFSADPEWLAEDIPYDTGLKQCKPQVQHCPWLSPAAPIPANGTSR